MQRGASEYLARAQDRIFAGWELPDDGMANREVVLEFSFDRLGFLVDPKIVSATDSRLKQSVAVAILRAAPFEPVPRDALCLVGLRIRTTFRNPAD